MTSYGLKSCGSVVVKFPDGFFDNKPFANASAAFAVQAQNIRLEIVVRRANHNPDSACCQWNARKDSLMVALTEFAACPSTVNVTSTSSRPARDLGNNKIDLVQADEISLRTCDRGWHSSMRCVQRFANHRL